MTSLMIAALLLIVLMQAMSRVPLSHVVIAGALAAILLYPLGKNVPKAVSPYQAYKMVKTVTAEQKGETRTYEFKPPSPKRFGQAVKSTSCRWFERIDQNQKQGQIRDRIRRTCASEKEKQQ